jgi:beta-galactosidase
MANKSTLMAGFVTMVCLGGLGRGATAPAQSQPRTAGVTTIDASEPATAPQTGHLRLGGRAPDGREIGVNSRYLTLDGAPWLPVMGEFHFSRYPEQDWDTELLKMKAGGIQIVTTYLFWIHPEEAESQFDWAGRRDLRRFIQLCGQHGMYAFVRIGPWAHGEARNGGFPDWLLHKCSTLRKNDSCYLSCVRRYFGEIGRQLNGLYWKDGGPVIGVQLENEYLERGPDAGAAHIAELRKIARESGIDVPLYTVTGWGGPEFPPEDVVPVFGGYPDAFWAGTLCELPPSVNYFFHHTRDDSAIGADLQPVSPPNPQISRYPFLTAELGGGMEVSYHRRPVISADDVAAIALAKLGSGANLFGYYMYHGGANPQGKLSTLQESQATGYPNDLPVVSYDFQAPLGEFGQVRPSYGALRVFHLFLRDFGSDLAPMVSVRPEVAPVSIYDTLTLRAAARTYGNQGFIFFNNYQRNRPLPNRKDVQITLKLPTETLALPRRPITIPAGAYFIWPVNLSLNGALLKYATAQLLSKVSQGHTDYYFFFAWPGIAPEFAFDEHTVASVEMPQAGQSRLEGRVYIRGITPGTATAFTLQSATGKTVKTVVLTRQQAEECYRARVGGRERVFLSPANIFFDGDNLHLRAREVSKLSFSVFPALERAPSARVPLRQARRDGVFATYTAIVVPRTIPVRWKKVRAALPLGPASMGKRVALAPTDSDFDRAGKWRIVVPENALHDLNDVFLRIKYSGDVARLYAGRRLLDDNFYNGSVWEIGLKQFAPDALGRGLDLEILPLRENAPIYLPKDSWPSFPPSGDTAGIRGISLSPEHDILVNLGPGEAK